MNQDARINLDIGTYLDDKSKGLVSVIKINGQPFYSKRGFNQNTGLPMPINTPMDVQSIEKTIASLSEQLKITQTLLDDITSAKEVVS